MQYIWDRIKSWGRWVYDWITVIVAGLVGVPTLLLQLLNAISGIDISPLVGPSLALKIVTGVAILKAVLALIESKMKAE